MRELTALSMDTGGPVPRPAADSVGLEVGLDPCLCTPTQPLGQGTNAFQQGWVHMKSHSHAGARIYAPWRSSWPSEDLATGLGEGQKGRPYWCWWTV